MQNRDRLQILGERLREARENRGLSQTALSHLVGKSKQLVSAWEAGRAEITLGSLLTVARVLGVGLDWLLLNDGKAGEKLIAPVGSIVPFVTPRQLIQLAHKKLDPHHVDRRLQAFLDLSSEAFAIANPDDAMSTPTGDLGKGEILVFDNDRAFAPGDLVFAVVLADNGTKLPEPLAVFRRYRPLSSSGSPYQLAPENTNWPTITVAKTPDAKLLGCLVATMRSRRPED